MKIVLSKTVNSLSQEQVWLRICRRRWMSGKGRLWRCGAPGMLIAAARLTGSRLRHLAHTAITELTCSACRCVFRTLRYPDGPRVQPHLEALTCGKHFSLLELKNEVGGVRVTFCWIAQRFMPRPDNSASTCFQLNKMAGTKTEPHTDISKSMENGIFPLVIKVLEWLRFHLETVMSLVFKCFNIWSIHKSIHIFSQRLNPQSDSLPSM